MGALSLEQLFAKLFIARPDVRAVQMDNGGYYPDHTSASKTDYIGFDKQALTDHLNGVRTYGHYLLGQDNTCKFFALDIDLEVEGALPTVPMWYGNLGETQQDADAEQWIDSFEPGNPREAWRDRAHPARQYMKTAMRSLAATLEGALFKGLAMTGEQIEIPTLTTYTGYKGLHLYGFTGRMPAEDVREIALACFEGLSIQALRGKNFYKWSEPEHPHALFSIEVFPKQVEVDNSGFGNLMRLPLGRNLKAPHDPTFFVDTTRPYGELLPVQDMRQHLEAVDDLLTEQQRLGRL